MTQQGVNSLARYLQPLLGGAAVPGIVGIVPFEFWVDGMAWMRKINAGPCCFAIHAPGRALDVGTWIAGTAGPWWAPTDNRCPWAPHYPPRLGEENHIERARRRGR